MPRYFFDILDGDQNTLDDEGIELESPQKARIAAARLLPEVVKGTLPNSAYRRIEVSIREDQITICRSTLIFFEESFIERL